jgi:hypothetical protein
MKWLFLILACALLTSPVFAQVNCATINQEEILHCDVASDPSIATLSVQRGGNYHCYREPRIVVIGTNNSETVYPVSGSQWNYTPNNQNITTTFTSANATFTMNSTTGFSPLSGFITFGTQKVTFRTCGVQRTSAYYWTQNSQNKLEAFSCPVSKRPPGCPKVGYNP